MPIHDYRCTACGHVMKDELKPPTKCTKCGGEEPGRLFPSKPPIAKLTVGGFHGTDYPKGVR